MTPLLQEFLQFQDNLIRRGRSEGKAEGKAEALLAILMARGVLVSEFVREKLLGCADQSQLDRWVVQAATETSVDEVFAAVVRAL